MNIVKLTIFYYFYISYDLLALKSLIFFMNEYLQVDIFNIESN